MYEVEIHKQAKKQLVRVQIRDRERIVNKLHCLRVNPDDETLDIKSLTNEPGYRLRVGSWRIKFARDDCLRIISITKIGSRGDVYK